MKDGLYHREIFWLPKFDTFFTDRKIKEIKFTQHVKENQYKEAKRIYDIDDITIDFIQSGEIFEIEVKGNKIIKIVVRKKYKNKKDICVVLAVEKDILRCKTCWLNSQDDIHSTLDASKYVYGEEKAKEESGFGVSISELKKIKNDNVRKR